VKKVFLVACFVVLLTPSPAQCQWAVFDASTFGAAMKSLANDLKMFSIMSNMAANFPGMPTRYQMQFAQMQSMGMVDSAVAGQLSAAANSGNGVQAAYSSATVPMQIPSSFPQMSAQAANRMGVQYGNMQLLDASNMAAWTLIGQARGNASFNMSKLTNLFSDALQMDSQLQVLQKMNAASATHAQQLNSLQAIQTQQLEQQVLAAQRQRNELAGAMSTDQARITQLPNQTTIFTDGLATGMQTFEFPD
jgi:hypothetical protein